MENKTFPQRKHPRLKTYDYSSPGAYFVTICTSGKKCHFGTVGRWLAPAEKAESPQHHLPITVSLTKYGEIAEEELKDISSRFHFAQVAHYVIMPNHIHIILELRQGTAEASTTTMTLNVNDIRRETSPRPTVEAIICAYKSLVAKKCKEAGYEGKLFQTSFYEHIIRNQNDYDETVKYIHENPAKWFFDELYQESP